MPPGRFLDSLPRIGSEPWPLDGGRESFQPPYARRFTVLTAEGAVFDRDDYAIVVAAFSIDGNAPGGDPDRGAVETGAHFAITADSVLIARAIPSADTIARFALVAPHRPGILSLEMLRAEESLAARSRRWLDLERRRPGFALSDLMLVRSDSALPATLADAARVMRASAAFGAGETVSLFWEAYDPPAHEAMRATLRVERRDRSFLRKAVEWLGLGDREHAIELEWTMSTGAPTRVAPGAVTLELPHHQKGRYLLTLRIDTASGASAVSHREIAIGR